MTASRWVVLRDRAPLQMPNRQDLLGVIVATDRRQARRAAERLFAPTPVVVVNARAWPIEDATPITYSEPAV